MAWLEPPPLPGWIARQLPPGAERHHVEVDGERMHVMAWGRGTPVVLLHGNPTWGFLYRRVVAALRDEPLRLIAPDLVGLGLSSKPRRAVAHTLERHARWVGALLDALGSEPVVLVGQDWGAPIGLCALADRPERLRGLVLMNTAVAVPRRERWRTSPFHRFAHWPGLSDLVFRGLGFPQLALWPIQGDRQSIRGPVARAYRWPLRGWARRAAPLALARMVPGDATHPSVPPLRRAEALVEGFGGPAALVWGERDPILGRAWRRTRELLPQARLERTAAGHFVQEEAPEAIARAVAEVARAARG